DQNGPNRHGERRPASGSESLEFDCLAKIFANEKYCAYAEKNGKSKSTSNAEQWEEEHEFDLRSQKPNGRWQLDVESKSERKLQLPSFRFVKEDAIHSWIGQVSMPP